MIYVFPGYEADDARLELRSVEGPVAIEPRVLETLIYLVRNRERVVSKQELLEQVWGTEYGSDAAVSRCIMEARRAIGDDGRGRTIGTVHGRGYRFLAPVEERDGNGRVTASSREDRGMPRSWGFGIAAIALLIGAVAWWQARREPPVSQAGVHSLALFATVSGEDADLQWLAQSLEDALRLSLASTPGVELREAERSEAVRSGDALLAGLREDPSDGIVLVEFAPGDIDGFTRVEMMLARELASGALERTPLGTLILPILRPGDSPEGFDSLRVAVVGTAVPRLMATLDPERSADPARREAWQLYLRAVTKWEPMCEAGAIEDLVRRSLELEPDFVPAWTLMAYVRLTQAKFCAGMMDSFAELQSLVEGAFKIDPSSSSPYAFKATALLYDGRVEEAYRVLEEGTPEFGDSLAIRLGKSTTLRYVGYLEASRRLFDEAVEGLPALPYIAGFVPYAYRYQGDWEGFLSLMTGQESPHYRFYRGFAEHRLDNDEAAVAVLEPAFAAHPGDLYGRLCQALLAIVEGNDDEARVLLDQLARQRGDGEGLDGEVTFEIAELMLMAGEEEAGLAQLTLAVEQGFACAPCMREGPTFESLEGREGYEALLERAETAQVAFGERFGIS